MLNKLQNKWQVGPLRLILIIITFAVGGSLCGYTGRKLLGLTTIDRGVFWVITYVLTVTILWPISVLLVSIPLGQFSFFKRYLSGLFNKMSVKRSSTEQEKTDSNT